MPASGKNVSKNDIVMRHAPFTQRGLSLADPDGREQVAQVEVHECGHETLGDWWNFTNVCTPFWRIYYNFDAGCTIKSGDDVYKLEPAQALIVPDGVTFDCMGKRGVRHMWIHYSLHSARVETASVQVVKAIRPVRALAATLAEKIDTQKTPIGEVRHLCLALIHLMLAEAKSLQLIAVVPRLRLIYDYITRHMDGEINNRELAEQAGMSVEGFTRWFRTTARRTPAEYIAEQRIREACRRLAFSEDTIEQIAEQVGFANRHHFSRVFKKYAGCGPAGFRGRVMS